MNSKFFRKERSMARQRVLQALYQWQLTGQSVQLIEAQFIAEMNRLGKFDIDYFRVLLRSILQQTQQLDTVFEPFLDRKMAQIDPIERAILWIGCYELQYSIEVPFRVAINEAIELAKVFGADESHKYINGILDRVAKQASLQDRAELLRQKIEIH